VVTQKPTPAMAEKLVASGLPIVDLCGAGLGK
jgi:hypothetical protein